MPGGWEWIIILLIVVVLFGVGRLGRLGSELGKGVRSFREGLADTEEDEGAAEEEQK